MTAFKFGLIYRRALRANKNLKLTPTGVRGLDRNDPAEWIGMDARNQSERPRGINRNGCADSVGIRRPL